MANDTYTGTKQIIEHVHSNYGITYTLTDFSDLTAIEKSITDKTKAILLETPTNPTMKVFDIQEISKICKKKNILLIVDNTTSL